MTLKRTLVLAGAAYALGRLSANLNGEDLRMLGERVRHMTGKDFRKVAMSMTDEALDRAGLVRKSAVTRGSAASMIAGMGAGILVGAGLALLFAPQSGSETRQRIGERVRGMRSDGARTETPPQTTGAG